MCHKRKSSLERSHFSAVRTEANSSQKTSRRIGFPKGIAADVS
jgi:hypothetical protein